MVAGGRLRERSSCSAESALHRDKPGGGGRSADAIGSTPPEHRHFPQLTNAPNRWCRSLVMLPAPVSGRLQSRKERRPPSHARGTDRWKIWLRERAQPIL